MPKISVYPNGGAPVNTDGFVIYRGAANRQILYSALVAQLDATYLLQSDNLADLPNAATARTNLGLVAGGAGDIWVEKAGDTMTGALKINVNSATALFVEQDGVKDNVLVVDTTNGRTEFTGTLAGLGAGNSNYAMQITANTTSGYSESMSGLTINNNFTGDAGAATSSIYGERIWAGNNGAGFVTHIIGLKIQAVTNTGTADQLHGLYVLQPTATSTYGNSAIHIEGTNGAITFAGSSASTMATKLFSPGANRLSVQPLVDSTTAFVINDKDGNAILTTDSVNNSLGINVAASNIKALNVLYTSAATTFNTGESSAYFQANWTPTSSSSGQVQAGFFWNAVAGSNAITGTAIGIRATVENANTNTLSNAYGLSFSVNNNGVGTITNAYGSTGVVRANTGVITNAFGIASGINVGATGAIGTSYQILANAPGITAGGAITTNYGVYISNQGHSAITNAYGLYIASQSDAASTNYAIYTNAGLNILGDQLKIDGSADRIQEIVQGHSTQTANLVEHQDSSANIHNKFCLPGAASAYETVFNEQGNQYLDFRVETDSYNALFVDASDNSILVMSNAAGKVGFFGAAPVAQPAAYTPSNVTPDRAYDADATTLDEVADVLGTLIADLQSLGLVA